MTYKLDAEKISIDMTLLHGNLMDGKVILGLLIIDLSPLYKSVKIDKTLKFTKLSKQSMNYLQENSFMNHL